MKELLMPLACTWIGNLPAKGELKAGLVGSFSLPVSENTALGLLGLAMIVVAFLIRRTHGRSHKMASGSVRPTEAPSVNSVRA